MTFGKTLKKHRKLNDLSIQKLSKLSTVSTAYISKLENNKLPPPSRNIIIKLGSILGEEALNDLFKELHQEINNEDLELVNKCISDQKLKVIITIKEGSFTINQCPDNVEIITRFDKGDDIYV